VLRLTRIGVILTGALGFACADTITSPGSVAGAYTLRTIDQQLLPEVVDGNEIRGATLVLSANGTFTFNETFSATPGGQTQTFLDNGTYTLNGTQLTLDFQSLGQAVGTLQNATIQVTLAGHVLVFMK
jgi:hypothetical protein